MLKILLIYILLICMFAITRAINMCGGVLCDDTCQSCGLCNVFNCRLEDECYCASTKIPGNLNLNDTP